MHRKRIDVQEPAINLTPLIDVVFVVLIAFILIAPLLERDNVLLASSGSASHQPIASSYTSPIQIYVRSDNSILLCGAPVSLAALQDKLLVLKRQYPRAKPQVFHDKRAHFGTYQSLKNCLERIGFEEMDIVLGPPQA